MKYQIELTPKQLEITKKALDVYGRLQQGSLDLALEGAIGKRLTDAYVDDRLENAINAHSEINKLRRQLFPELADNEAYGVGSKQVPEFGISYTIYEVLRHQQWIDNGKKDKYSVDGDRPLKFGSEPIPSIRKVED